MKTMTVEEICLAVKGELLLPTDKNIEICAISTDTRKIAENSLFVPFKGENFDGHKFIEDAFKKGAVCALSSEKVLGSKPIILVEDTRQAFCDLAMYYLSLFDVKVVGITGSVGKTTTKDIIASVLETKYKVLKTEGNFNNDIGLPKTIFNLRDEHQVIVLEMGMNNFGEISRLSKVAKPDIAVITNVGVSHIENLGSREGILKAKSEIFDYMEENGVAVLNIDDDMLCTLKDKIKPKTAWFGIKEHVGYFANDIESKGIEGIDANLNVNGKSIKVSIKIPGEHMVLNALSAAVVGDILGLELGEIKKGIENFIPTAMRMDIIKTGKITIINDAYNANPVSMKAAIDVLCGGEGRKVAILGDMFELGTFAEELHYDAGKYVGNKKIDISVCIGENGYNIYKGIIEHGSEAFYFKTQDDFISVGLDEIIECGDICLVKASRGMNFERTVEKLQGVK